MKGYKLLINGEWTDSSANETFENIKSTAPDKTVLKRAVS